MDRPMLLRLPNELLITLIEYVDGPSCAALARTCHTLNPLATLHLYKSANIQLGKSNEFVRTVKAKYAKIVRHVAVVVKDYKLGISPCRIVPCLKELENLQSLTLAGGYWMWDTDGENWGTLEASLWKYFERASLKQPRESRVARSLRSLTLDRSECNGQGAFLHYPYIFIIPQLYKLTIRGFMLEAERGEIDPPFERQTELKELRIEHSFVSFPALRKILIAPRALSYLSIFHVDDYWYHDLRNAEINHATVAEFVEALSPHRLSLKEIKVAVDSDGYGGGVPSINASSFRIHATQFPALQRWLGCDKKTLADYLNPDEITSLDEDVEDDV